jgi:hypothetical protein
VNCPLEAAWELSRAWPEAEPRGAEDAGPPRSETTVRYVFEAIERFADPSYRAGV